MRHTIELDTRRRVAIVRYHGVVEPEQLPILLNRLVSAPDWTPEYSRVIDYSDGLLGLLDEKAMQRALDEMADIVTTAYGTAPNFSAQVCDDPMKRPFVEYWLAMSRSQGYPASGEIFASVDDAVSWIDTKREPTGSGRPRQS